MAGLVPLLATLVLTASPEAEAIQPAAEPAVGEPAATSEPAAAEPVVAEPVAAEPAATQPTTSESVAVEATTPEPVVSAAAVPAAHDDEVAPQVRREEDEDPVERFEPGQWGMQFTFGGLAPMSIGGVRDFGVNRLTFTEMGFRRVLGGNWMVPFSIGAGVFNHSPDQGPTQNDVGLAASVGVQRYFRVWRRIAPFAGGRLRMQYAEPNGRANWLFGVGLGPVLGIEYFVGHRVSLTMQGTAQLGIGVFNGLRQVEAATQLDAGGQMGLTFYF